MTLHLSRPRAKRRWALLGTIVMALSLAGVAVVQAQLDRTLFELDKDASANNTFTKIGVLNAAVAAAAGPTNITICQDLEAPAYDNAKILIDAERMTLGTGTAAGGGGCPSGFTFKTNYSATRGVDGTTPGAHAKAEDVSKFGAASPSASHDWDEVYASISADTNDLGDDDKCISLGAVECVFVHDERATSIFTQSKDYDEISDEGGATAFWQWRDQSVPDADELDDGMAIKYIDGFNEQHIFFGADRFATNGTKDAGIWLFHDEVAAVPPANGGDGTFTGLHTAPDPGVGHDAVPAAFCDPFFHGVGGPSATPNCATYDDNDTGGDVFILTSFSGGGATVTARVFEWIGPAGSTAALLERSTSADCVPGTTGQPLCATVNNTTAESGTFGGTGLWPYSGKSEPAANEIASGGLLEGGANLTDLGLEGCFSSVMWATRSSDTLTADPKDWILGQFEACGATVVTTPKTGAGGAIPSTGLQLGTGLTGVTAQDSALLTVTGTTNFTGTLKFFICGPIGNAATCTSGGVPAGTINNVTANGTYSSDVVKLTSAANNTTGAPGRYCWRAEFSSTTQGLTAGAKDDSATECFFVKPVTPTLSTTSVDCTTDHNALATVDFPGPFCDKAVLGGTANKPATNGGVSGTYLSILTGNPLPASNGAAATGSITFTLVGPDAVSQTGCPSETVEATGTNPQTVNVTGDASYFTAGVTVSSPGVYHWKASYTGDNPNTLGKSHNDDCSEGAETITVNQIPTVTTTRQFVFPQDKVKIDSTPTGATLSGNVTFRLFEATGGDIPKTAAENCSADDGTANATGLVYNEGPLSISGTAPQTKTTNNTSYRIIDGRTYVWHVTYTSLTSAQLGSQSACVETVAVTFGGNDSSISIP